MFFLKSWQIVLVRFLFIIVMKHHDYVFAFILTDNMQMRETWGTNVLL